MTRSPMAAVIFDIPIKSLWMACLLTPEFPPYPLQCVNGAGNAAGEGPVKPYFCKEFLDRSAITSK